MEQAVEAVKALWSKLNKEEKKEVRMGDVRTDEAFRVWSNPELYVNPGESQGRWLGEGGGERCSLEWSSE